MGKVIIGAKELKVYLEAVCYEFEKDTEVELHAMGRNVAKLERIVKILKLLGVKEINRRIEKKGDLPLIHVVRLKRG
jgi:DNA-binding protein